jgi:O-antigen/teichoic acid export membrane protein
MSLLKKLAGETAIYGLSSILGRLLNYVLLTPYLTRVFSTESF